VLRGGKAIVEGVRVETLRRFTEDVNEVRTGFECGIKLVGQDELIEGDIIELYEKHRVR
jgi:translation initiation factor IF-2